MRKENGDACSSALLLFIDYSYAAPNMPRTDSPKALCVAALTKAELLPVGCVEWV